MIQNKTVLKLVLCIATCCIALSCMQKTENNSNNHGDTITVQEPLRLDSTNTLKEKELLNYVKTALAVKPNKNNGAPFATLDYDKLIAYDFEGTEEHDSFVIDNNGKFISKILKQQYLTQSQADNVLTTLSNKDSYEDRMFTCFSPRLALVFYKGDKLQNQISICVSCDLLWSDIPIPAQVRKGTGQSYLLFTEAASASLNDLGKELGFRYIRKPSRPLRK